ncbi:MAG: alpha/beta fold hydrolase [Planctomycetes bacterium]|nr:alpha/beta fold hydrolase [Planctomycetota bacterium]
MTALESPWSITGADGQTILGDCHTPARTPLGVLLIVHGFLGYKDYGMFPPLARAMANAGYIAHRFNLSHSGMTNAIENFERLDLFERDTWRKQVHDVCTVVRAIDRGELAGQNLPYALFGHSRGGDTCLLAAAEMFEQRNPRPPNAVITAAAPSALCRMDEPTRAAVLAQGFIETRSNRTGQTLRIGKAWLQEQIDDPDWHDLCARIRSIACPLLILHGQSDPTVPVQDARELADAARTQRPGQITEIHIVPDASHVFNTPNPMPRDQTPSDAFAQLTDAITMFVNAYLPENMTI